MKVESHNHPSAVEPFQGAATGVGGILRDIFTMGARPIALLDSLRFGSLDNARSRHLANGVIGGIGWYGNCVGVPTVGGEVAVSSAYDGNPLVNAMCVGIMRHEDLRRSAATGVGNPVILFGADTGRDGVHGATFASLADPGESHRGVVQVGDPFLEKLLIEACLELRSDPALVGLQDLGATGLTSATVEAAARGGSGISIDVDAVPRRADAMARVRGHAEREPGADARGRRGRSRAAGHGRPPAGGPARGRHRAGHRLRRASRSREGGVPVADLPIELLTDVPTVPLEPSRPSWLDERHGSDALDVPPPADLEDAFLRLLAHPDIASRSPVFSTYDHMVGTDTVVAPGGDAAVLRIKGSRRGIALVDRWQRPTLLPRPTRRWRASRSPRRLATSPARARSRSRSPTA